LGQKGCEGSFEIRNADVAANMADGGFTRVPNQDELQLNPARGLRSHDFERDD
jgi:hypothetical protein